MSDSEASAQGSFHQPAMPGHGPDPFSAIFDQDIDTICPSEADAGARIDPGLAATIRNEIIPRLFMTQTAGAARSEPRPASADAGVLSDDARRLADLSIDHSLPAMTAYIDTLEARGVTAEMILVDLLPAAARHLGVLWEYDERSFVEVTYGMARLQHALHIYARTPTPMNRDGSGRPFLLSSMPGEQHTFALGVVEAFFCRAGWCVETERPSDARALLRIVRDTAYDVVGLSASADRSIATMPRLIRAIRKVSRTRDVRVIVGGGAILRSSDRGASLGADAIATDCRDGLEKALTIVSAPLSPR